MFRTHRTLRTRVAAVAALLAVVGSVTYAQNIGQLIKIIGVGAVVKQFGPEMNSQINKLTGHQDSDSSYTKVVPIISVGIGSRKAIGAAQVRGSKSHVDQVKSIASPQVDLFGHEIVVRALIPVATDNPTDSNNLKAVEGVGVSGIVDLKL